jgi:hypothetical protein
MKVRTDVSVATMENMATTHGRGFPPRKKSFVV